MGESWREAGKDLWASEPALEKGWPVEIVETVGAVMQRHAQPGNTEPDDLLLAVCAFPDHPCRPTWIDKLEKSITECSVALLPGLLMHKITAGLANVAEYQLVSKLLDGAALDMPITTTVAAARVL